MATSVGSACITLMPSMDGFAGKICGEFGSTGSKAGNAFGNTMTAGIDGGVKRSSGLLSGLGTVARGVGTVAAAGMTALTGAVTAIGGAALSAYADYEQLVGGVDTLFGSASGQLQAYAADAYKTCGMSANQYMTQATSFAASLVSSCGGDVAKAADYANMAMGDMSDNVNKMGSNMVDVQNAYQGFAKQNYTMLDNLKLGYGGTKEEMERLIADANKLREAQGKNADLTIDSYADVVEAIHTVQENMGITGTTAKEAATTISGSIGMAKAAWENFITGLGRDDVDFSQLTEQLLTSIGAVATNVAPRVAQIGQGIIQAFPIVLAGLGAVLAPIVSEALATAWNIAVQALAGIGIHLPEVDASQILSAFQTVADVASTVVGVVRSAFEAVPGIFETVASAVGGAVSTVISVLTPFAEYFAAQMLPAIVSFASGLVSAFAAVWPVLSQFGQTVMNIGAAVMPVLQNAFALIMPLISQAISLVMQLFSALSPLISQVAAALMPALTAIGTALANLAAAVLPGLAAAVQVVFSVLQMLMPVIQTVLSVVGSIVSVVLTVVSQVIAAVINAAAVVSSVISAVLTVVSALVAGVTAFIGSILAVVGGCVSTVSALVAGVVNTVVSLIGSLVSSVLSAISGLVSGVASFFQSIVSTMSSAASSAYSAVTGAFNSMVGAVSGAVGNLMGVVSGIPGQITGFFAGAGSWLVDSGRAIIDGLVSGIQSAIGGALGAVGGAVSQIRAFFPFSPAKTGPFSGHGYTTFSGKALMEGWAEGIGGGTGSVVSAITGAMETAQGMLSTGLTAAPASAGVAVAGGTTYNITVNGGNVNADQRIMQAVDVLVSAAKRSAGSGR
nr:MAG TPA: tail tape measure protein [Caudoviricetes sp.]